MKPLNHNNPPSLVDFAVQNADDLGQWLKENPVIETVEQTREAKVFFDRATDCLKDMEAERKLRGKPLSEQIDLINGEYRTPKAILAKIRSELVERLDVWRRKEEEIRRKEAEEARQRVEEAERLAREAEAREQEAKNDAKLGAETDLVDATRDADVAYSAFQLAEREAARANVAADVKITGGFRRALGASRFEKREVIVVDPAKAIACMGWSERMLEALKSDARQYKRDVGKWPAGIIEEIK